MGDALRDIASDAMSLLFQPRAFYGTHRKAILLRGHYLRPVLFGLVAQAVAASMHVKLVQLVADGLSGTMRDLVQITLSVVFAAPEPLYQRYNQSMVEAYGFIFSFWSLIVGLAGAMAQLTLLTVVTHMSMLALVRPKAGIPLKWHTTFKTLCYAQVPWVLALIPWAGSILAFFLSLSVAVQGLAEVYGISSGRAMTALAFPFLIFGVFFLVMIFLVLFLALNLAHLVF